MTIRLRRNNQITIPAAVIREAGFKVGDELIFKVENRQIVVTKKRVGILEWVASLNGFYDGYDFAAERADAW